MESNSEPGTFTIIDSTGRKNRRWEVPFNASMEQFSVDSDKYAVPLDNTPSDNSDRQDEVKQTVLNWDEYIKHLEDEVDHYKIRFQEMKTEAEHYHSSMWSLKGELELARGRYRDNVALCYSSWSKELWSEIEVSFSNFTFSVCPRGFGLWKGLPKETKKDIMARLKGWVAGTDFDELISRWPPNFRFNSFGYLAQMIITKDCLETFFTDPFWYLTGPGEKDMIYDEENTGTSSSTSSKWTPMSSYFHDLYQWFLKTDAALARHWRCLTVRLMNIDSEGVYNTRDPEFGNHIKDIREAKAIEIATTRMADSTLALLLGPLSDKQKDLLTNKYVAVAHLGMKMAQQPEQLRWRTLEEEPVQPGEEMQSRSVVTAWPDPEFRAAKIGALPATFHRHSTELNAAHAHRLWENRSRLERRPVISVITPAFVKTGGWASGYEREHKTISQAHVIMHDPVGIPGSVDEEDIEAQKNYEMSLPAHMRRRIKRKPQVDDDDGGEGNSQGKKRKTKRKVPKGYALDETDPMPFLSV